MKELSNMEMYKNSIGNFDEAKIEEMYSKMDNNNQDLESISTQKDEVEENQNIDVESKKSLHIEQNMDLIMTPEKEVEQEETKSRQSKLPSIKADAKGTFSPAQSF